MQNTKGVFVSKTTILIALLIMIISLLGVWEWKNYQMRIAKKKGATQMEELREQMTLMKEEEQKEALKLFIQPFVWSVRNEWLKNNKTDIQFFADEIVKKKGLQYVIVADHKGKIIATTNKKWTDKPFDETGIDAQIGSDSVNITKTDSSLLVVQAPVMGFHKKLGSVVVTYKIH